MAYKSPAYKKVADLEERGTEFCAYGISVVVVAILIVAITATDCNSE